MRKLEYILRRLATSVLVLFVLTFVTFFLARVVPTDPAALYIGPHARQEDIDRISHQLGFDQPLTTQYFIYMRNLLQGDWGDSIGTKRPVLQEIGDRLPSTLQLLFAAMFLAIIIGIPLGVISSRFQGKPIDAVVRSGSIVGVSLPAFWLGLILQIIFFRTLNILPLGGDISTDLRFSNPITPVTHFILIDAAITGNWVAFKDALLHLVLPAFTLAAYPIGLIARMTRATMLEVLSQDYIRTARAYGISDRFVTYGYALKNALGPALTVIGLTLAYALTGSFFVEIVFNWPGLGQWTVRALSDIDYPAIMGVALFGAIGYVLINLVVDLIQAWIDPRISLK